MNRGRRGEYDGLMGSSLYNALVILGPTASGKTRLGVQLADERSGEIISADSRQVYRELNIGSGKDLDEYEIDGHRVPYHLIDVIDLHTEYSVFDYQKRFYQTFEDLSQRSVLPVVVGGTGLYLEAALRGYRLVDTPENPGLRAQLACIDHDGLAAMLASLKGALHNTTDLTNRDRLTRAIEIAAFARNHEPEPGPGVRPLVIGVHWTRSELRHRIATRLKERLEQGMIEEVEAIHAQGIAWERIERLGLEYRFIAEFLQGRIRNRNDLFQKLHGAICRFAKRQDTWFRRMERQGTEIHWIPRGSLDAARDVLQRNPLQP